MENHQIRRAIGQRALITIPPSAEPQEIMVTVTRFGPDWTVTLGFDHAPGVKIEDAGLREIKERFAGQTMLFKPRVDAKPRRQI